MEFVGNEKEKEQFSKITLEVFTNKKIQDRIWIMLLEEYTERRYTLMSG